MPEGPLPEAFQRLGPPDGGPLTNISPCAGRR